MRWFGEITVAARGREAFAAEHDVRVLENRKW